jgi:hypothetical protein
MNEENEYLILTEQMKALKRRIDSGDSTVIDLTQMCVYLSAISDNAVDIAKKRKDHEYIIVALDAAREAGRYARRAQRRLEEARGYDLACHRSRPD